MFSFLNPILLWALLALLVPLLIHLFSKQRVKKVDFSSLFFLRSLEKTKLRAIKIKSFLLLLIRSLIIFFVVLAFARPSTKSGFASKLGAKAKSSILFLMDNSYRMGYETKNGNLLKLAQKKGEELLKIFKEGDELYLITYHSEPEVFLSSPTFDSSIIAKSMREAGLSFEPADLDKALKSGLDLIAWSKNENKELFLLTDLKSRELVPLKNWSSALKDEKVKLFIIKLTEEEKENWGIKKIELPGAVLNKETPLEIKGVIKNYSSKPVQNLLLSLYLDGKRVSQTVLELKEGEEKKISFTQSVKEPGVHSGYLELSDDNLLIDNKRFFTFRVPERIQLLLVGTKWGKDDYLGLSLNPKGEGREVIQLTQIDPKGFSTKNLSSYKVIVFTDFSGMRSEDLSRLDDFLKSGGGVFFFFGEEGKELFPEVCRRYLNSDFKGGKTFSGEEKGFLSLEKLDFFHPVFQPYRGVDKAKFPQIRFFSIYEIIPGKKTRVLANFSNGAPALIETSYGLGKVLGFLSSCDPKFSDLGEHTLFVPLIRRSVEYLSSSLFASEEFLVGENIRREYDLKKTEKIELFGPEGLKLTLNPESIKDKLVLKLEGLKKPGIYKLFSGDKILDQLAVNLDQEDSDFEPLKDKEIETGLKDNVVIIGPDQDLAKEVWRTRFGRELSKNFLWLALGLLILEMLISRSSRKDLEYFSSSGSKGEEGVQKI